MEYDDNEIVTNNKLYLFNETNNLITKQFIEELLKSIKAEMKKQKIKYCVNDIDLFVEAMTHKSYLTNFIEDEKNSKFLIQNVKTRRMIHVQETNCKVLLKTKCYERLEFLGDSVIRLIVAEYLYNRYSDKDEGFMTRLKTKIENGESLANLCKIIDLNQYMIISKHVELNGGRTEPDVGILGDIFESFIGALYLDSNCNLELCKIFVTHLIETKIDIAKLLHNETNYKDMLLKYFITCLNHIKMLLYN